MHPANKYSFWGVGTAWVGLYSTNSRWNNNVEHVIFAACSELNNGQQFPGSVYDSRVGTAANGWALTLLGTPNRAHQILGYMHSSPGDGPDIRVVDSFFGYQAQNKGITNSWAAANMDRLNWNWAFLEHASTRSDVLPGWGTSVQPPSTTIDIDYWWYDHGSTKVDITSASLDQSALVNEALPSYDTLPETWQLDQLMAGVFEGQDGVEQKATKAGGRLMQRGETIAQTFLSGALHVDWSQLSTTPATSDSAASIALARSVVERIGGLPADAGRPRVDTIRRSHWNPSTGQFGGDEKMADVVVWERSIKGVAVQGEGADGIHVVVGAAGPISYRRLWRQLGENHPAPTMIGRQALSSKLLRSEHLLGLPELSVPISTDVSYYAPSFDSTGAASIRPCWSVTYDSRTVRLFDAESGERLGANGVDAVR